MKAYKDKDNRVIIELSNTEAAFIHNILRYCKEWYFKELDNHPKRGSSLVNPEYFKDIYNEALNKLDEIWN